MKKTLIAAPIAAACAIAALVWVPSLATAQVAELKPVPAVQSSVASQAPMLAASWAGMRIVSVGAYGIVLLSDDEGTTFRQAKGVPVSSTLTGVSFIDGKRGWAVGQWGAILATEDGGDTWKIQRLALGEDRPLFAVQFTDASHGVAVGLWSLILVTSDGGNTWGAKEFHPANGSRSDANLFSLFTDKKNDIFITSEKGTVLRSRDGGNSWHALSTGYSGSLWCGAALSNGSLLVGGQRGTLMRSDDDGRTWVKIPVESKGSITSIAVKGDQVLVVGLDGLEMLSKDGGQTFVAASPVSSDAFTAALPTVDGWQKFSRRGVVMKAK